MAIDNSYKHFEGLAAATGLSQTLLPQAILSSKKSRRWKEGNMDRLEMIGLDQLRDNIHFRDFYKMVEGRLVYSDYQTDSPEVLRDITKLREEIELPTFVKHYDIIGRIVNAMVGYYSDHKDKYRVHSTDPISKNDFIIEKTDRLRKFVAEEFNIKLKKKLIERGINPNQQQFQSEEEKQAYLQQIEATREEMSPAEMQMDMQKNWKTKAAEWAENTLEHDGERFRMDDLDKKEMTDYLLTGRFFRHYRVGYDNYEPERWDPVNTFFSRDLDIESPQDGEYVGRVHYFSASKIIDRYGHLLTSKEQQELTGYYDEALHEGAAHLGAEPTFEKILENNFSEQKIVPEENYYERELGYEMEEAFGVPMGEMYYEDENGDTKTQTSWLPKRNNMQYLGNQYAHYLRDDITVRRDLIQVTEAYWRSFKRIGLLTYETEEGIIDQEIVTEDILNDFLKEHDIKKLQSKTLEELEEASKKGKLEDFINTVVYTYVPEIWKGIKVNKGNSYLKKDLYLDVKPLEFQIKGNSEVYDLKLPVAGIIGNSMAQKIRPYQIGYNYCMNQIYNLLEKEIGMFFLFDVNYLPSEFKDQGTSEDWMLELRDLAHEVGIVPIDSKKQNTQNAQQFNTFMAQSITYDTQIQSRISLAEYYEQKALQQIGITEQMLGNPSEYSTAEGIKKSDVASFAQLDKYFSDMRRSKLRLLELHLAVAQYAQGEEKDPDLFYARSDGDIIARQFFDPNFPLRRLGVLPTADSKSRKELEMIKQYVLNNNTMDNSLLSFAQLITADTTQEILSVGRRAEQERIKAEREDKQFQSEQLDKQIQAQAQEKQNDWEREEISNERDRQNKVQLEYIEATGRAADKEADPASFKAIEQARQNSINNEQRSKELALKEQQVENQQNKDLADLEYKRDQMMLEMKKLKMKEKELDTKRFTSTINKN